MERIVVNPNAAYDKFKDKHVSTKGLGQFIVEYKSLSTFIATSQLTSKGITAEYTISTNGDWQLEQFRIQWGNNSVSFQ